jgi:hypothetical protein
MKLKSKPICPKDNKCFKWHKEEKWTLKILSLKKTFKPLYKLSKLKILLPKSLKMDSAVPSTNKSINMEYTLNKSSNLLLLNLTELKSSSLLTLTWEKILLLNTSWASIGFRLKLKFLLEKFSICLNKIKINLIFLNIVLNKLLLNKFSIISLLEKLKLLTWMKNNNTRLTLFITVKKTIWMLNIPIKIKLNLEIYKFLCKCPKIKSISQLNFRLNK